MIMTVDIGGTKTLCALWKGRTLLDQEKYATSSIKNFPDIFSKYAGSYPIRCLCIAAAGPVNEGRVELTNTGQKLGISEIRKKFAHIPHITLINDLEALACSLPALSGSRKERLKAGDSIQGASVILSLGTGLGVSALTKEGHVLSSEGGHMDFAPADARQAQLWQALNREHGHVSCERVLSGQGLVNIHTFLTGRRSGGAAEITSAALRGNTSACEAMEIFTEILGAVCGNLALLFMARGGVWLGGGMLPKILPCLDRRRFCKAFEEKGRFRKFLQTIPVYGILDENAVSLGAAVYAEHLTGGLRNP